MCTDESPLTNQYRVQAYGLTETNSVAVSVSILASDPLHELMPHHAKFAGEDYVERPTSTLVLMASNYLALSLICVPSAVGHAQSTMLELFTKINVFQPVSSEKCGCK